MRRMRFFIVDSYYEDVLNTVYATRPELRRASYAAQMQAIYDVGFARADFLPNNLRFLGHEAEQVVCNAEIAQETWAAEHGFGRRAGSVTLKRLQTKIGRALLGRPTLNASTSQRLSYILSKQIETYDPDIIFNCELPRFPSDFWKKVK